MDSTSDTVVLQLDEENSVTVHLHGATVTSWKVKGEEMLFVSSKAVFDNKKAIRGGIPLVFPNFGPWSLGPQHGFARISRFTYSSKGPAYGVFSLSASDKSREMWPYEFDLHYHVQLVEQGTLELKIEVINKGDKPFDFTTLLHTYFRTSDVRKMTVSGFKGCQYEERVGGTGVEEKEQLTVSGFIDRTYMATSNEHVLTSAGGGGGKTISMQKVNLPDTVVWNPWQEKAAAMSDFGDDDYPFMICVEAGFVSKPVTLGPSSVFEGSATMKVTG